LAPLEATEGTTDRVRRGLEGEGMPPSVSVKMAPRAPLVRSGLDTTAGLGRAALA
jgi:hypothetical protein